MVMWDQMREKGLGFADSAKRLCDYCAFYDRDVLVGFSVLSDEADQVFLGVGVEPSHCSQGYGAAIVGMTVQTSWRRYPGKTLYLEVRTWNARAIRCYSSCGFVVTGEREQTTYAGRGRFFIMERRAEHSQPL